MPFTFAYDGIMLEFNGITMITTMKWKISKDALQNQLRKHI